MVRFSTVISYVAFLAALVMMGLGITGMVTAKSAQGPECVNIEQVQANFAHAGAHYKAFGGEETKLVYAAVTAKYGPSPDGEPFALLLVVSPESDRAALIGFNEEGCLLPKSFGSSASTLLPLIADALGKFAND